MGRPWLDKPVGWHSSRERDWSYYGPLTDDEKALISKPFLNWYTADLDYSLNTVYFFCAAIGLLFILNTILRLRSKPQSTENEGKASLIDRIVALARWFTSRQYVVPRIPLLGTWYSPSIGVVLGLSAMWIFLLALLLGKHPYNWPSHKLGHSMPIATRSGWLAIGIMPFMIAFSTKVNWVAILTASPHERMQVWHRWSALIMYIASLVHTFPFIVNSIKEGTMVETWNTSSFYWTGVVALVPQTWLCGLSWGIFRNPYYETFKKLHFAAAAIFMVFLFLHVDWVLTSWDYFWATLGLYSTAFLFRILRTIYNSPLGCAAHLSIQPDGALLVRISVPPRVRWTPGQHVFLRFFGSGVGLHTLSSHPFTISTVRGEDTTSGTRCGPEKPFSSGGTLDIVAKVHGGISGVLARMAGTSGANVRVFVDGPYGGVPKGLELRRFDEVLLLTGGTGATLILPILTDIANAINGGAAIKRVKLIVAVRDSESLSWIHPTVQHAFDLAQTGTFTYEVHITGSSANSDVATSSDGGSVDKKWSHLETYSGRPILSNIVHKFVQSAKGRVAVAACGPDSFLHDSRNAIAECQLAIANGSNRTVNEIFLHTENYSW